VGIPSAEIGIFLQDGCPAIAESTVSVK